MHLLRISFFVAFSASCLSLTAHAAPPKEGVAAQAAIKRAALVKKHCLERQPVPPSCIAYLNSLRSVVPMLSEADRANPEVKEALAVLDQGEAAWKQKKDSDAKEIADEKSNRQQAYTCQSVFGKHEEAIKRLGYIKENTGVGDTSAATVRETASMVKALPELEAACADTCKPGSPGDLARSFERSCTIARERQTLLTEFLRRTYRRSINLLALENHLSDADRALAGSPDVEKNLRTALSSERAARRALAQEIGADFDDAAFVDAEKKIDEYHAKIAAAEKADHVPPILRKPDAAMLTAAKAWAASRKLEVLEAGLVDRDWTIRRHPTTGVPTHRVQGLAVVVPETGRSGVCRAYATSLAQAFDGKDYTTAPFIEGAAPEYWVTRCPQGGR